MKPCPLCLNEGRETLIRDDEIMCNKHLFPNGRGSGNMEGKWMKIFISLYLIGCMIALGMAAADTEKVPAKWYHFIFAVILSWIYVGFAIECDSYRSHNEH